LRASEAGVRLEKLAPADLPEIVADKRSVNQILLNLLSNAIRFTDRGGTVTVSARAEAATITFAVEDDGVGISEADLVRVGEPYFQAATSYERRHSGTGLGLSIVKGLVRLHGGELLIRSRVGEGTRVTVRLPLDCERARPVKKLAAQQSSGVVSYLAGNGSAPHAASSDAPREAAPRLNLEDIQVKKSA
jgi:cell cycle sensor histidine kinase DivJ